ncbi:hypothetical protein JCM1840_005909 [Sporobolomyces johnsonii]
MFAALRPATRVGARAFSTSRPAARDLAKMTLIGRVGAVQTGESKSGKPYLMYKVATTDRAFPPKEGEEPQRPSTSWHTIFAHGQQVERLSFLEKGTLVYVEASFTVRNEKDEAGNYQTEISATHERLTVLKRPAQEEPQE